MDKIVRPKTLLRLYISIFSFVGFLAVSSPVMSYEEPKYKLIKTTDVYEVRRYQRRTVAQVTYGKEDSGFRLLFNYISGANESSKEVQMTIPVTQSEEIDMTLPVTQSNSDGKMAMNFFLPNQYSKENAPLPRDTRVSIIDLPEEYYAIISYSGFASDNNFEKHHKELSDALENDGLVVVGPPIKATYNSPFTPPFLRRNEAMFLLKWN